MRLIPDTIVGRVSLVLVGGLVAALMASAGVYSLDLFGDDRGRRFPGFLRAVSSTVMTLERMPPHMRPMLVQAMRSRRMRLALRPAPPRALAEADWRNEHLRRGVESALARHGLTTRVVVGWPGAAGEAGAPEEPVGIAVYLSDGTWVHLLAPPPLVGPLALVRFLAAVAVLTGGVVFVAVWAARRLTAPLERLTEASARLGTDVNAPPLPVEGPREVREAATTYNEMQRRIQRFTRDRTEMLAAISHDLRTALTRLRLRAEFITDDDQRARAEADLEEMNTMLGATLSFARDDAMQEATTRVDLTALVATLCNDLADAGQAVSHTGPERCVVEGRPVALRRALANVIDNAVAYGEGAEVTVEEDGEGVRVRVRDRGPGIPKTYHERVFAPFFRMEGSRNRDTGGTGLGLAVSRSILRGHGGDVTLSDHPEGGLVVTLSLPPHG